ncbi:MAG: D-tyrosyl-tRNA(Tyr) deacylase [Lachnospiraceae bacterium]|nr:D-tyrosyl-tRNA(Tyr) deacylase [Lachnospiraceae bacterium]
MRFLIQRVEKASVSVGERETGSIGKGLLVFVGVGQGDDEAVADKMVKKMLGLRIFADENGKTNLSLKDVNGELLIVSQFTLYADCRHGNRPGFTDAGDPETANRLYEYILRICGEQIPSVQHGEFGADMQVSLINDGPYTIMLDSAEVVK